MTAAMEQPTPAEITTSVEAGVWSDDPRPRIWTRCLDGDYLLMSTEETLDDAERNLLALEQLVEIKRAAIERARTLV